MLLQAIRNWWASMAGPAPQNLRVAGDSHDDARQYAARARELRAQGENRAALAQLEAAVRVKPDDVPLLLAQAELHLVLDETVDARDCFELALAHAPDNPEALLGLARTLRMAGDLEGAMTRIARVESIAGLDPRVHFEAAIIHSRRDDLPASDAAYRRGLELAPDDVAGWTNLGLLYLIRMGRAGDARRCFERAIALDSSSVEAQANLGLALEEQGNAGEAIRHYDRLIAAHPDESEYRWNRGLALLASGDYARGWDDYEMRNARKRGAPPREFPFPAWAGEDLPKGTRLLIYGEQGLGDEVMFASCVPDLLARGIVCTMECDARLAGLFARSFPSTHVHGAPRDGDRRWLDRHSGIAAQIPIGSLPRLVRRSSAAFPAHSGYLVADPQRISAWRTRLSARSTVGAIGIAWRGGTRGTRAELRSLALEELAPVLRMPGVCFVNLQRGGSDEVREFARAHGVDLLDPGDAVDDFEEVAALCKSLDRVVTVDNSLAHLAGALGCPASVLLSASGDWRWVRGQRASVWYPSVTLHRQTVGGSWTEPVDDVRRELEAGQMSKRPR